jgi:hypothetical protein
MESSAAINQRIKDKAHAAGGGQRYRAVSNFYVRAYQNELEKLGAGNEAEARQKAASTTAKMIGDDPDLFEEILTSDPKRQARRTMGSGMTQLFGHQAASRLTPDVQRKIDNMVHAQEMGEKLRRFIDSPGVLGDKIRGDVMGGSGVGTGNSAYDAAYMDMLRERHGGQQYRGGYEQPTPSPQVRSVQGGLVGPAAPSPGRPAPMGPQPASIIKQPPAEPAPAPAPGMTPTQGADVARGALDQVGDMRRSARDIYESGPQQPHVDVWGDVKKGVGAAKGWVDEKIDRPTDPGMPPAPSDIEGGVNQLLDFLDENIDRPVDTGPPPKPEKGLPPKAKALGKLTKDWRNLVDTFRMIDAYGGDLPSTIERPSETERPLQDFRRQWKPGQEDAFDQLISDLLGASNRSLDRPMEGYDFMDRTRKEGASAMQLLDLLIGASTRPPHYLEQP